MGGEGGGERETDRQTGRQADRQTDLKETDGGLQKPPVLICCDSLTGVSGTDKLRSAADGLNYVTLKKLIYFTHKA